MDGTAREGKEMMNDMYACEVKSDKLPPGAMTPPIGRSSLDGVWWLVRCAILRSRTTPEQRQELLEDGYMIELTHSQWLTKAESTQYKTPEE